MALFKPDYYVRNYKNIDLDKLKKRGIKLLLCDIDNTLVAWNDPHSNEKVRAFLDDVKRHGIVPVLISNNTPHRAAKFSKDLNVEKVYGFSLKPSPHNLKRAMKDYGVRPEQTAMLGDQLLTDMLAGRMAGVYTILTHPIVDDDKFDTRINRALESLIYKQYERNGTFHRGEFDD